MHHLRQNSLLVVTLLALLGCRHEPPPVGPASRADSPTPKRFEKVRQPAVAGIFYPAGAAQLRTTVDRLLADAKTEPIQNLRA